MTLPTPSRTESRPTPPAGSPAGCAAGTQTPRGRARRSQACSPPPRSSSSGAWPTPAGRTRTTRLPSRPARAAGRPSSSGRSTLRTSSPSTSRRRSCGRWTCWRGSSASTPGRSFCPRSPRGWPRSRCCTPRCDAGTARAAGLIAAAALAATPVAAMMFRFNNPDAMLTLLMTLGAYAVVRAVETGRTRWVLRVRLAGRLGLPGQDAPGAPGAPGVRVHVPARRALPDWVDGCSSSRVRQWRMFVSAGWWVAIVELWPASSRPYIGGSQTNSVVELIFGYNGFGRLTGNENGSVGGAGADRPDVGGRPGSVDSSTPTSAARSPGCCPPRSSAASRCSALAWRAPRTDRLRASAILWGGWLLVTGLAISLGKGIIHTYYTIALAPAIAALVGIGAVELWKRRTHLCGPAGARRRARRDGVVGERAARATPTWMPALHTWLPRARRSAGRRAGRARRTPRTCASALAVGVAACALAAPAVR